MTFASRLPRALAGAAAAVACTLALAACSTAGTPMSEKAAAASALQSALGSDLTDLLPSELQDMLGTDALDALSDRTGDGDTFQPRDTYVLQPIAFHLWQEAATPDGWLRVPAKCEAPGGTELIDRGAGWYTFAVPGTWGLSGHGSAGSGSPLNDDIDLKFTSAAESSRSDYHISIEPDRRDENGNLVTWEGETSDGTFDYKVTNVSSTGEKTYQIAFEPVGTVPLGEQQLEVFVAHQAQEPEILDRTAYKVRFQIADTPMPHVDSGTVSNSATLTIEHDAESERSPLTAEIVQQIAGSVQMPTCTENLIVVGAEMQWSGDLNDDGYVSTMEDYQEALKAGNN